MADEPGADFDGRVVVVTGATRGIGRQIALQFATMGAEVVVVGRTSRDSGLISLPGSVEDAVDEIASLGGRALGVPADLTGATDTAAIVDRTLTECGRCDVLINNAAYTSNGAMLEVPWNRWERAFRVQVVAPHQLCHGFLPGMRERGEGRVVNISTGASQSVMPGLGLYSTSKLAMERWSDYLHTELTADGDTAVAVNTLRFDRLVATEGWRHTVATKGIELATGGDPDAIPITTDSAATAAVWVASRPLTWSGHTVGFDDVEALGGPAVVEYEASGAAVAGQAT